MEHTKKKPTAGSQPAGGGAAAVEVDRRATPRITLPSVKAEVVSPHMPVTVIEVGFGGLSVASEGEFEVDDSYQLRCSVANRPALVLHVRVRHCRRQDAKHAPRYITGFQFIETWVPGDNSAVDRLVGDITIALSDE